MAIGRTSTGMYHRVIGAAANCNGRSFNGYVVKPEMFDKAPDAMLCKKCFPKGRESLEHLYRLDVARGWA